MWNLFLSFAGFVLRGGKLALLMAASITLIGLGTVLVAILFFFGIEAVVRFAIFCVALCSLGLVRYLTTNGHAWAKIFLPVSLIVVAGSLWPGSRAAMSALRIRINEGLEAVASLLVTPQRVACTAPFFVGEDGHPAYWHVTGSKNECFNRKGKHPDTQEALVPFDHDAVLALMVSQQVAAAAAVRSAPPPPTPVAAPVTVPSAPVVVAQDTTALSSPSELKGVAAPAMDSEPRDEPPPLASRINQECAPEGTAVRVLIDSVRPNDRAKKYVLYDSITTPQGSTIAESQSTAEVTVANYNRTSGLVELELSHVEAKRGRQWIRASASAPPINIGGRPTLKNPLVTFTLNQPLCSPGT